MEMYTTQFANEFFLFICGKEDYGSNWNLVNIRCYLASVVSTLWKLKDKMTRRHQEILGRTPFTHLMDVELIIQERVVIDALIQLFDEQSNGFMLGERYLLFRTKDVSFTLGL